MRVLCGTSGWSYKEWKPAFYPQDVPQKGFLAYYASRLPTVEVNNTFYRMPKPEQIEAWAAEVGPDFRFVLKASQRITHQKKLRDTAQEVTRFYEVAGHLGPRRGPVLFQLPPWFKQDLGVLRDFLAALPADARAAFEFRHASWFADDTYAALRDRQAALCIAEDEDLATPAVATAPWGYLRLRRQDYGPADLARWADTVRAQSWSDAFVFFKHEDEAAGPKLAEAMGKLFG